MAALFFDIDETLLSKITGEIPKSAIEGISRAKLAGHQIFINTGRTFAGIPANIRRIGADGYLCGCGTYIVYHGEVLLEHHISIERGNDLIDRMEECRIEGFLEGTEDIYFSERVYRQESLESVRRYMASMGLGRETAMEKKNFQYDKLLICIDEKSDMERFRKYLGDDILAIDRRKGVYECIQKSYSKATAIRHMQEVLGIGMDEVYVFGDSSNDLAMFEYAKHTIAMGVHDEALDPYTEYVTDTVENDGVYKAMEYYKLF